MSNSRYSAPALLTTVLLTVIFLTACTPKLSPLYRDYEITEEAPTADDAVLERIEQGLREAGWELRESITQNVVATEERNFRRWGLYSVKVSLEVAPIGGDYVRLMIHPYRRYAWGTRSKIPYLRGSLARSVLKDLHASFEDQGLEFIGTRESRDQEDRENRR